MKSLTSIAYKTLTALMIVMLALATLPITLAHAAAITVNTLVDEDTNVGTNCSLREAIVAANTEAAYNDCAAGTGVDNISFSVSGTITLGSSLPNITDTDALTINGGNNITVSGNNAVRIVTVNANVPVIFQNITLINGAVNGNGGAINNSGNLSLANVTFRNNRGTGGGNNGGALYHTTGTLAITGGTFGGAVAADGNYTGSDGGAIYINSGTGTMTINGTAFQNQNNAAIDDGGALFVNGGTVNITNSNFSNNAAPNNRGGAIFLAAGTTTIMGGIFSNNTAADTAGAIRIDADGTTISGVTFQNNVANGAGGGAIWNNDTASNTTIRLSTFNGNASTRSNNAVSGGAIYNQGINLIVANSTFTGNNATESTAGGAGDAQGGAFYQDDGGPTPSVTFHNVTFSNNTAVENGSGNAGGGNLSLQVAGGAGTVTLANTIVNSGTPNNCAGTITNGGNNIDSAATCGWAALLGSVSNTNPNLGSLTGSPAYFPLNAGSPAINTGSNAICATATSTNNQSQNGLTRPQPVAGICDIGSNENAGSIAPTIASLAPTNGTLGAAYTHTYTATGTAPITFSLTTGALPTGLTLTSTGILSGTPTAAGLFTATVTAANGTLPNATQNFSINIAAVPPSITSAAPASGILGVAYNHAYTATGTAPITYSVTAGALPNGLTLSSVGVLSGNPTAIGIYVGTVTATNGVLPDATQNFSITINEAPAITSPNNASFTLGSAGTFTVTATGSPVPTLSVTGALPTGVTFTPATGVLAGTPVAGTGGSYPLTITATNGVLPDAVQNFTLTVTDGPSITSANNTSFSLGLPGTFTVTAIGSPAPTLSMTGTLPAGVTFTPATGVLAGTPAAGTVGSYPLTFTATNGILPNATQAFTLTVKNGPIVAPNGINSVPDTGNGSISNNESIANTLGITQLIVKFDQDVYDPAGNTDPKDVTNPANYMLVLGSSAGVFQTVSCLGGIIAPDVAISVDSVAYSNGGGSGPFVATVNINGGLPLNANGFYRLYVCGTTSIVDAADINLELAGDGTNPGTDFLINFRIQARATGGGGGGNNNNTTSTTSAKATLIPVTGFAPHKVTVLPAQPADKAYKSLGEIRIEIPSLGINYPIVGAMIDRNTWDLTWLKDVAYLEGSAYPTLAGNTVLTAHVRDANKNLGPFSDIKGMQIGQKIYIHANGQTYVYQVQENTKILPSNISAAFKHEENSWITLVTCEDYNAKTELYSQRRMVRAVLISVIPER